MFSRNEGPGPQLLLLMECFAILVEKHQLLSGAVVLMAVNHILLHHSARNFVFDDIYIVQCLWNSVCQHC